MKKYKISSHYLDKCISIIEDNCYSSPSGAFTGEELDRFCSKAKNLQALNLLEAAHEIRTDSSDGNTRPFVIWLEDKGVLHLYAKREKRISAIKGFIAGVISTIVTSHLIPYLISLLPL